MRENSKNYLKKYDSIVQDLTNIINELSTNPKLGIPLGKNCYKIRFAIKSKSKGKSGGGRIISYVQFINKQAYLLDIYDKSEQNTISDEELIYLIELLLRDDKS